MTGGERVGAAKGDRPLALLAIATELRAGDPIGLGLGAAGVELDRNRFSLGRVRHSYTSDTLNIRLCS